MILPTHIVSFKLGNTCQKDVRWLIQRPTQLESPSTADFPTVILHYPVIASSRLANHNITQANIGAIAWHSSSNPYHQSELNPWEGRTHLRSHDRRRCCAIDPRWQAGNHHIVATDFSKSVGVRIGSRL